MQEDDISNAQVRSQPEYPSPKSFQGVNTRVRVDCFSSWQEINKNNPLGVQKDSYHDFPADFTDFNFVGFGDERTRHSMDCRLSSGS